MANTEHSLLVEKYRPNKLENYVGNENIKKINIPVGVKFFWPDAGV